MILTCTHKKCRKTYEATSQGALKILNDKRTAVYHPCVRGKRELRLMREVTG